MRSGLPSTPPSPYRQLGSGGQQPVRVQMIIGLVVGLVLVAVPLYLWRRPEQASTPAASAEVLDGGLAAADGAAPYVPLVDAAASPKIMTSMIIAFVFAEAIAVISLLVIFHLFVR